MKYFSKTLVLSLLLTTFVVPHAAHAAWWNPFSWFKKEKNVPAVVTPVVPGNNATSAPVTGTTSDPYIKNGMPIKSTPLPPAVVPPKSVNSQKPATTSSTVKPTKPVVTGSTTVTAPIEIPTFALNPGFTPAGFVSPRDVENGAILLTIEAQPGKVQAIGTWYVDSITWKMVSDTYRSGDLTVSVRSGQKSYGDSSVINELFTTKLSSHLVSTPISFVINGQTPRKGKISIVVESIKGHTSTGGEVQYAIGGTPLNGPEFSINGN